VKKVDEKDTNNLSITITALKITAQKSAAAGTWSCEDYETKITLRVE
jgi:hypothetical protein